MSIFKTFFAIIGMLIFGALGALLFVVLALPWLLTSPDFANYQFVQNFKQGKIVVNQERSVYIQQNSALQDAILRVKPSIVTVLGSSTASGLIATSDGLVITLANAIPANGNFQIVYQGITQPAKIVKMDYKNNLALLKLNQGNLQTVAFADSGKIALGQRVFLVAPTSLKQDNWFVNEGIVRQIDPTVFKTTITEKTTAAGGPLFNSAGELVGLNFIDTDGKISAVPIGKIKILLGL